MTEVVAALIRREEKFLICQRPAHKARGLLWEFVGGKVEPGETPQEALVRECREERAVTVSVGEVFMDVIHEYPDLKVHLILFHQNRCDRIHTLTGLQATLLMSICRSHFHQRRLPSLHFL